MSRVLINFVCPKVPIKISIIIMNKLYSSSLCALALAVSPFAQAADAAVQDTVRLNHDNLTALPVVSFRSPYMVDQTDVNGNAIDNKRLLRLNANRKPSGNASQGSDSKNIAGFEARFNISTFVPSASVIVEGASDYIAYVDGKEANGPVSFQPGTHTVRVDVLQNNGNANPRIALSGVGLSKKLTPNKDGKRMATLADFSDGKRINGVALSPDGTMLLTRYTNILPGGDGDSYYTITSTGADKRTIVAERSDRATWMPASNKLYTTRKGRRGTELVTFDPITGAESVLLASIPNGGVTISPTEDFAIVSEVNNGPTEDKDIYQVLEPEDRQPGWRNRVSLLKVNFSDGSVQPLTFGNAGLWLLDIADDGSKALICTKRSRLEKRPTTVFDIVSLDLNTLKADTIVSADGFVTGGKFSPDGKKILVAGTPEALGGVGLNLPAGRTASMTESELFLIDAANHNDITPLTRNFDPSVQAYEWSRADGKIYLTAEDYDYYHLYSIDPKSGKITQIKEPEDLVKGFSVAQQGNLMAWWGQGASNPDRLYLTDLRRNRHTLIDEPSAERLAELYLGKCRAWSFDNGRGDSIYCRYYFPADFDPAKKYPLIVNYYGGCSPTSRNFESRYPHNLYAAQGYGVLVIIPSGATGRGQEFASRHVNTAGEGVAEDIIAGTKQFCAENPWVDASKIGCIGASYGGFMTQYLQTVTDIFAAAISHAGISDHTSYWGEGYWGYSYSETSMANSYPWSHKDLYVDQSPLFRADKVNTPILFLHGDADTNVPVGESIQMFTALKLLGKETAYVAVSDQNHHILDYDKRIKWQNTIFAWFEKYLKNDSSWWNAMYPPKTL